MAAVGGLVEGSVTTFLTVVVDGEEVPGSVGTLGVGLDVTIVVCLFDSAMVCCGKVAVLAVVTGNVVPSGVVLFHSCFFRDSISKNSL